MLSFISAVIPDTLLITHSRILSGQPVIEGTELQLTCCHVGPESDSTPHGVRHVRRARRAAAAPESLGHNLREIIGVDRELRVTPGHSGAYGTRYRDGEESLWRSGRATEAGICTCWRWGALAPEDSGSYFCEAAQWIRDPDSKWERIAQRTMELGNLTVQPLG